MDEIWKDICGFEGIYQISSNGNLRSLTRVVGRRQLKGKILKSKNDGKYVVDILCNKGKRETVRRHRLVAQAFILNPDNKPEINHVNGIKDDNRVENLEWVTHRENTDHAWKTGLTKSPPPSPEKRIEQIFGERQVAVYCSIKVASVINHISSEDICKCCKGLRESAGGYEWAYWEENNS